MNRIHLLSLIIVLAMMSACSNREAKPAGTLAPYVDFRATVVSLDTEQAGYREGDEIYRAPEDSAVVRIEEIYETGGQFDWSTVGIEEGGETTLYFRYTARPARVVAVSGETTESGNSTTHDLAEERVSMEDGYFIFEVQGDTTTQLPGLQEGNTFTTRLWRTSEMKVGAYEIS